MKTWWRCRTQPWTDLRGRTCVGHHQMCGAAEDLFTCGGVLALYCDDLKTACLSESLFSSSSSALTSLANNHYQISLLARTEVIISLPREAASWFADRKQSFTDAADSQTVLRLRDGLNLRGFLHRYTSREPRVLYVCASQKHPRVQHRVLCKWNCRAFTADENPVSKPLLEESSNSPNSCWSQIMTIPSFILMFVTRPKQNLQCNIRCLTYKYKSAHLNCTCLTQANSQKPQDF